MIESTLYIKGTQCNLKMCPLYTGSNSMHYSLHGENETVSNSTNINKTNFYFSPQIIEHKVNNDIMSIEMYTLTLNRHLHMGELNRFV